MDQENTSEIPKHSKHPIMHVSRRDFLRFSEIAAISTLVTSFPPLLSFSSSSFNARLLQDTDLLEQALNILSNAALFQDTALELQMLGFQFAPTLASVTHSSAYEQLIGIAIAHQNPTNPRTGADLLATIDLSQKELKAVEYLVGWCLVDSLELFHVIFDGRLPLYEELRDDRLIYDTPPRMLRPRSEQNLSYWRPDSPPVRPEDLVLDGWPVEMPDWTYWYYNGCANAGWRAEDDALFYRCTQISEHRSPRSKEIRAIDL
jgi:hypothetical protein